MHAPGLANLHAENLVASQRGNESVVMVGALPEGVLVTNRRLAAVTASAALAVAFARRYAVAHSFPDAIVGLLFGTTGTVLECIGPQGPLVPSGAVSAGAPLRPLLTSTRASIVR